ncbi:MAG: ferrous iron transport protein B [Candidatus Bathyarchaeia archaeon]|nr:ferrous iron transport protein B [Candidatus Bathyarchaeota archaeon]
MNRRISPHPRPRSRRGEITVALAGNANVGKSVIFNQLTGLNQIVGNWPGKTVERAEGTLYYEGRRIRIIDLPGTYSLSAFSMEELIAREYIAEGSPDVVVNVVDASALERNLYLTLQLLELKTPLVMALNQIDFAAKKGVRIDAEKLSKTLGIPVVPTVATSGLGINQLLAEIVALTEGEVGISPIEVGFGREVEEHVQKLEQSIRRILPELASKYPARWLAVKLIERDEEVQAKVLREDNGREILSQAESSIEAIERIHGEPAPIVIASERYSLAAKITRAVTVVVHPPKLTLEEKLDSITTHKILGYIILGGILAAMFTAIFLIGGFLAELLETILMETALPWVEENASRLFNPAITGILTRGGLTGIVAGVTIALPYIVPFYFLLSLLEDSGYLPRAAFLLDNPMHKLGLHGKASICLLLGFGCSVPACMGCRIMETQRERLLGGFLTVLVPCAARSVVILGLVGRYVGIPAALGVYAFDITLIFLLGRLGYRVLPGEPIGLIMEVPQYKRPSLKTILKKAWIRTREFIFVAFPIIIGGSLILEALNITGISWTVSGRMAPIVSGWLRLPEAAGIPLMFGVLRKELTMILLAEVSGTTNFSSILTPVQMVVFSLVTMLYIPCMATIGALIKEYGLMKALTITLVDVALALLIGGLAARILPMAMAG